MSGAHNHALFIIGGSSHEHVIIQVKEEVAMHSISLNNNNNIKG